ncbi:unnamed protein product [Ambrosiozyma monospora]|uniref:Unnamed protein product n=1 Tax=Ambrosiozyma monospora TaxID=43982 RepID=A0ACB5T5F5_AMBMO|nr:unnamed protein product [Ambrosiozyma monospora]
MVQKYTSEELLSFEKGAVLPEGVDLTPFLKLVEQVKEALKEFEEAHPPRRKSFTHPKKKRVPKEIKQTDGDGWTSFVPTNAKRLDSAIAEDDGFTTESHGHHGHNKHNNDSETGAKQHAIFKHNSSKISSGKAGIADSRDTVAVTQTSKFNAFDALNDDDEE